MQLNINGDEVIDNPTQTQIADIIEKYKDRKDFFAILSVDGNTYVQTSVTAKGGLIVEYQEGSLNKHYQSKSFNVDPEMVIDLFLSYLAANDRWRDRIEWKQMNYDYEKIKNKVVLAVLAAGALFLIARYLLKLFGYLVN